MTIWVDPDNRAGCVQIRQQEAGYGTHHAPYPGMSIRKIISYVDLANSSRKGVQLTAAIAEAHGASVEVVLTAAKVPLYSTPLGGTAASAAPGMAMTLLNKTQEAVDMRLAEAVRVLEAENPHCEVTTHRLRGHQVDALIEHAQASGANLIVMSCEAAGLFDRVFHQGFAEKLARTSSCPVIVMAGETEVTPPLRNILVATDYSECSRRAALAARDIAGEACKLSFHHVLQTWPESKQDLVDRVPNRPESGICGAELEKLEAWVSELRFTDVDTKCSVSSGPPASEIARVASESGADIVVVGSRPHEDWNEKLFGTVTDRLIEICECPVLAVPRIAVVTQVMSKLDETLSQSFPASDPSSSWAGPPGKHP
jgi:nucleotide-binding universal stress UspA family protein